MEFVIFILTAIGIITIFFAGTIIDDKDCFAFFPLLIGAMVILAAIITTDNCVEEASIRKYANNEVTYDTVSMNKEGKLLEIKVIKNE